MDELKRILDSAPKADDDHLKEKDISEKDFLKGLDLLIELHGIDEGEEKNQKSDIAEATIEAIKKISPDDN